MLVLPSYKLERSWGPSGTYEWPKKTQERPKKTHGQR